MFVFLWGTKRSSSKLGYVADFCPVCRTVREMKLERVGMVDHVFYIPLGRPRNVTVVGTCAWCEGRFDCDPASYAALEKKPGLDLLHLTGNTQPKLAELVGKFIEDDKIDDRQALIRDRLLRVDKALESRTEKSDLATQLSLLSIIAAPALWLAVVANLPLSEPLSGDLKAVGVLLFFVALVVALVVRRGEPKRYFAKRLLPLLVQALAQAQPTADELKSCLSALRKSKFPVARFVSAAKLVRALREPARKIA